MFVTKPVQINNYYKPFIRKLLVNTNFFAVILGFDDYDDKTNFKKLNYAEKDALDLYNVLTNFEVFGIPKDNITLINKRTTLNEIEEILYKKIVLERNEKDTVMVYYSGHGFYASRYNRPYLAVPDVSIKQIEENPKNGLSMTWLHDDIFLGSPANQTIFLLDCCHSGSFSSDAKQRKDKTEENYKKLIDDGSYNTKGRVAFASSLAGVDSRESEKYKNGIFTHFLLEGLEGNATDKHSGDITLASLVTYVLPKMPDDQQPILSGTLTNFVLAPAKNAVDKNNTETNVCTILAKPGNFKETIVSLPNPLDEHIEFLEGLLSFSRDNTNEDPDNNKILNSLNRLLESDIVFVEEVKNNYTKLEIFSEVKTSKINRDSYRNRIVMLFNDVLLLSKEKLLEIRFGVYKHLPKTKGKFCICLPLSLDQPKLFLFICGIDENKLRYGQILGRALLSLFEASRGFSESSKLNIENIMLDDLRRWFGYVPAKIYSRKKEMFLKRLEKVHYYFQPIVQLQKRNPQIYSWEALARDPDTNSDPKFWRAPADLFSSAELWGPTFLKELDIFCLHNSVNRFVNLWKKERINELMREPLSVNVYAETLFSNDYKSELKRLVKEEEIINSNNLVLEISERRGTSRLPINSEKNILDSFLKEIASYSREFNISFAIDDFGIGYSSVDRLAKLHVKHIKIDKDVLNYEHPLITINYVSDMVRTLNPSPANIVIEGFDEDKNINVTLKELFDNKINYIQGHIIRKAENSVKALTDVESEIIKTELSKQSPKREDVFD